MKSVPTTTASFGVERTLHSRSLKSVKTRNISNSQVEASAPQRCLTSPWANTKQDWQLFRGTPSADDVQQGESAAESFGLSEFGTPKFFNPKHACPSVSVKKTRV